MNTLTKKQAILQSLNAMDASEMNQVLDYIKELLHEEQKEPGHEDFKKQALLEINEALKNTNQVY